MHKRIDICFWCGKEEVVLVEEKPVHEKGMTYSPCTDCQSKMDDGLTVFEVVTDPLGEGQPPISGSYYPTGRWAVVEMEGVLKGIKSEDQKAKLMKDKMTLMSKEMGELVGLFPPDKYSSVEGGAIH